MLLSFCLCQLGDLAGDSRVASCFTRRFQHPGSNKPVAFFRSVEYKHPMQSDEYGTPPEKFHLLSSLVGGYHIDVAATRENALCECFMTEKQNALETNWYDVAIKHHKLKPGEQVKAFCNPPYSKQGGPIVRWIETALRHAYNNRVFTTLVLPADTSTQWFFETVRITTVPASHYLCNGRWRFVGGKSSARQGTLISFIGELTISWKHDFFKTVTPVGVKNRGCND